MTAPYDRLFPPHVTAARQRNNPPPSKRAVVCALEAVRDGDSDAVNARMAFHLLNACCIVNTRSRWYDARYTLTGTGADILARLRAEFAATEAAPDRLSDDPAFVPDYDGVLPF